MDTLKTVVIQTATLNAVEISADINLRLILSSGDKTHELHRFLNQEYRQSTDIIFQFLTMI